MVHFDVKDRSDIPAFFVLSLIQLHIGDIVVFLVQQLDEPLRETLVPGAAWKSCRKIPRMYKLFENI